MLIASVLQILDTRRLEIKGIPAAKGSGNFQVPVPEKQSGSVAVSSVEKSKEKQIEAAGLVRPLLPVELPSPALPSQRGFEEFLRVVEEVNKEGRFPILDVFQ